MNRFNNNKLLRIFSKIPTLETSRLIMRRLRVSDYIDMYEYSQSEEVTKYLLWYPHKNEDYTYRYLEYIQSEYKSGNFYDWALVYKPYNKMIGTCGFTNINLNDNCAEIGYVLNSKYWGMGIATEAALAVIDYGFNVLNLNRIEAKYIYGNDGSRRVMEKCGMTFEGIQRAAIFNKNEYKDIGICSILSREYFNV